MAYRMAKEQAGKKLVYGYKLTSPKTEWYHQNQRLMQTFHSDGKTFSYRMREPLQQAKKHFAKFAEVPVSSIKATPIHSPRHSIGYFRR